MGKIHDALEKSRRDQRTGTAHPAPRLSQKAKKQLAAEKVVPLKRATHQKPQRAFDRNLVTYYKPQSLEAELFKMVRSNILHPSKGAAPRSIMVTSAVPGEGKSFFAANLAVSIARGVEEHVLLVDGDMRHPTVHRLFKMRQSPGLSEHLAKGAPVESILMKTPIDKLSIISGGRPPINPSELLSSRPMADLLNEVKQRYEDRYVILDSPPPHLTAETSVLAQKVDGILIVVRAGKTPRAQVEELVKKIGKDKIIGVVMNWFDTRLLKLYGSKKYGKYYQGR